MRRVWDLFWLTEFEQVKALCFRGKGLCLWIIFLCTGTFPQWSIWLRVVFPELDEIVSIEEDFPWKFFSTAGMERSLGSSSCWYVIQAVKSSLLCVSVTPIICKPYLCGQSIAETERSVCEFMTGLATVSQKKTSFISLILLLAGKTWKTKVRHCTYLLLNFSP